MVNRSGLLILGSTGSIGRSTLSVVQENPAELKVVGLSCHSSIEALAAQVRQFHPEVVCVGPGRGQELKERLDGEALPTILEGESGQAEFAGWPQGDTLVAAMVGAAGIKPVLAGIAAKKRIALANKETIVLAGELIMKAAKDAGVEILPVDSEHNAIAQSLAGSKRADLSHITLTASGGPFRTWDKERFETITLKDALNHPNWSMGDKITIDSATMMNKGLEVIEAKWLFGLEPSQIKVVVHPESIVHSMVTYKDGSSIAQLGEPDMRVPIAYCLGQKGRLKSGVNSLDLAQKGSLTFFEPDYERFGCLKLAFDALQFGGGAPAALNGANEELVALYLNEKIHFTDISRRLSRLLLQFQEQKGLGQLPAYLNTMTSLEDALAADSWGRTCILER